jgi:hypothetical protein
MSTRLKEEWPYVPFKSRRSYALARWEEGVEASHTADWMRWGATGLLVAAVAVTVLSGIAVAALHEDDAQAKEQQVMLADTAPACVELDSHLQELLRAHRRAVFGN